MTKKYTLLTFIVFISCALYAQVKIIKVSVYTGEIVIKNFSADEVNISDYVICDIDCGDKIITRYEAIEGSFYLPSQESVRLAISSQYGKSLTETTNLILYLPETKDNDYNNANYMVDFVQWGSSGSERETVAVQAGLWNTGNFINDPINNIFTYIGNGAQNGLPYWTSEPMPIIRFLQIVPDDGEITIKNFGETALFIRNFKICSQTNCVTDMGKQDIVFGGYYLEAGKYVTIKLSGFGSTLYSINNTNAGLSLHLNSDYQDTLTLLDFVQWGGAGNDKEDLAAQKQIWEANTFISVGNSYQYTGNGAQNGVNYWTKDELINLAINQKEMINSKFYIYPNPAQKNSKLWIEHSPDKIQTVNIFNSIGGFIGRFNIENNSIVLLDNQSLNVGQYIVKIEGGGNIFEYQILTVY